MWFKNRRAKWRKQKREEQERLRKLQEEHASGAKVADSDLPLSLQASLNSYSDADDSSDLEVA